MKKMFACVLVLCPMIASADYLDDKIAFLTKEKQDKIAKLEECQKSTKGLKIAGITTLGVSAIGIGANIGEAVKLNKLDAEIGTAEATKSDLDKQISAAEKEKAAKNVPTDKTCSEIDVTWKAQNNAKFGACDTTTGENYITECADTYIAVMDASGRITECNLKEQAQSVVSDRTHHSACTDAEKTDLQAKGADEVWVYNNKCVPKSCKTDWYLVVKGKASQGYCVKICPGNQKVESWPNGGKACDKSKPETAPETAKCFDLKQQIVYYGYIYTPSTSYMEVKLRIGVTNYDCGSVAGFGLKKINDPDWRTNKARELAEKKLKEMNLCNYQLAQTANFF